MTVHYTGGTVLMADDVAEALMQYARVLAAAQDSDVLVIPVVDEHGEIVTAEFLVGPSSQLLAVPAPGVQERARDQAVLDDIRGRARRYGSSVAMSPDDEAMDHFDHDSS